MRLTGLRRLLREQELDAILISQPENRRYLSGFTGSAGWLIITAEQALLATDFRYFEQVGRQAPAFELAKIETRFSDLLPELLSGLGMGISIIGYDVNMSKLVCCRPVPTIGLDICPIYSSHWGYHAKDKCTSKSVWSKKVTHIICLIPRHHLTIDLQFNLWRYLANPYPIRSCINKD